MNAEQRAREADLAPYRVPFAVSLWIACTGSVILRCPEIYPGRRNGTASDKSCRCNGQASGENGIPAKGERAKA
jgi:hypothetical protein